MLGDEDRRRRGTELASGVEEEVRRASGRLRSTRGAPAAVTRESGRFGDRRRRRNLAAEVPAAAQSSPGGGAERGVGLELGGPGGGSGEGWGKRRAAANLKGGPRASWGSVPWRRGAILGEKGGVHWRSGGERGR